MLKRLISGSVYVAIIIGFLLLRRFVDYRLFDILVWFMCSYGTFEIARALKEKTGKATFIVNTILGILYVPIYYFGEYVLKLIYPGWVSLIVILLILTIYTIINAFAKEVNIKKFLWQITSVVYPSALLTLLLLINRLGFQTGWFLLLLTFVVSPATDTFAYLVGMAYSRIRKGNVKKLCPKLSPKKTVAGAIGGLVGGVICSLLVYFILEPSILGVNLFVWTIFLGLFASVFAQIGDLFESFIKRSVGIKDIGKIMPGHGGVMDRIDGTVFTLPIIYIFALILI